MTTRAPRLALASIATLMALAGVATAQPGRGGMVGNRGNMGGGGGGVRPGIPQNFARPSMPQNFARPNVPQNFARPNIPQNFSRPNLNQNFSQQNLTQNFSRPNLTQNTYRPTNINQNTFNQNNVSNRQNNININNVSNVNNVSNNRVNNFNNDNRGGYGGYGVGYGGYRDRDRAWGGNGFYGSGYQGNSYYGYHSNWVNGSLGGYSPGWGGYPAYGVGNGYGYGYGGYGVGATALGIGAGVGVAAWGLGSLLNNYGYSQYSNPYYAPAYSAQPASFAAQSIGYDYSRPLDLTSAPPDQAILESSVASLDSARDAFHAGDYPEALSLADRALKQTPNDPMLHEFRATALFALRRYDEAAVPFYTVLSAGPGWDWTTLIGLYPDIETYTAQLRALEAYCNSSPRAASARFVLAALYLTQGAKDAAAIRLREIVAIQPQDRLSAQLLQALTPESRPAQVASQAQPAPAAAAPAAPANEVPPANPTPAEAPSLPAGPVPANLVGPWTASPSADVAITLTLVDDKSFSWKVVEKGQAREFKGEAKFDKETLALVAPEMPPMVAKVTWKDAGHFNFKAVGTPSEDPGLDFGK